MRITIDSGDDTLVLDGQDAPNSDLTILADGVSGWYGSPAIRETGTDRPHMDGAYWPNHLTVPPRTVSIQVLHHGMSSLEAAAMADRLCALNGQPLTMIVQDQAGTRSCECYLADDPAAGMLVTQGMFTATIVLYCPDPHRYGPWQWEDASDGGCRLPNAGNIESWPAVHATRATRLDVRCTAGQVTWSNPVPVDVDLDFRDMIPTAGTVSLDRGFPVPPGGLQVQVTSDAASVSMGVRPAWR